MVDVTKSMATGVITRPKTGIAGAKPIAEQEDMKMTRAKKEVFDLLCRAGAHSAAFTELFSEGLGDPMPSEETVLFGALMARIQPKAIFDYCKEVNLHIDWLCSIKH